MKCLTVSCYLHFRKYVELNVKNPTASKNRVFPNDLEENIVDYIKYCDRHLMPLTVSELEEELLKIAEVENVAHKLRSKQKISSNFLNSFLRRHPKVKREVVNSPSDGLQSYSQNLSALLRRYDVPQEKVLNVSEIILPVSSSELGTEYAITVSLCVTANGETLPPFYVCPSGSGLAKELRNSMNSAVSCSGKMTTGAYLYWLQMVEKYVTPTAESPAVLIVDSQVHHKHFYNLTFARDHHFIIVGVPPFTNPNGQLPDRLFLQLFKAAYESELTTWRTSNLREVVTDDAICQLVNNALKSSNRMFIDSENLENKDVAKYVERMFSTLKSSEENTTYTKGTYVRFQELYSEADCSV